MTSDTEDLAVVALSKSYIPNMDFLYQPRASCDVDNERLYEWDVGVNIHYSDGRTDKQIKATAQVLIPKEDNGTALLVHKAKAKIKDVGVNLASTNLHRESRLEEAITQRILFERRW